MWLVNEARVPWHRRGADCRDGAVGLRSLVIDAWSWLNYKIPMNDRRPGALVFPELAATWLPEEDLRRVAAYKLLAAFDSNQAGQLAAAAEDDAALEHRELGDASRLVEPALGYLLGAGQHIVVAGAERTDDEVPPEGAVEAAAVQGRLRKWTEDELLALRMQQTERTAVLSGDGVYVLVWESERPSGVTCYLTDAEWQLDDLRRGRRSTTCRWAKPVTGRGRTACCWTGWTLRVGFIPVIHLSNTIPLGRPLGAVHSRQGSPGLDELAGTDSDGSSASGTTGTPIIGPAGV